MYARVAHLPQDKETRDLLLEMTRSGAEQGAMLREQARRLEALERLTQQSAALIQVLRSEADERRRQHEKEINEIKAKAGGQGALVGGSLGGIISLLWQIIKG
jgi:hypothetical protein